MAAPVRNGEELELRIDSLAYGGNGVARLNGFVVFVRRALPGDTVRAQVTKVKRGFAEATALEILEPGPDRVEAPCPHFGACGGCRFQDYAYERQLESKALQVRDALVRLGGIAEPPIEPIVPAASQYGYRNKLEYSFTQTPEGAALGFHRAGRWDEVLAARHLPADDRARQRRPRRGAGVGAGGEARGLRPGHGLRIPPAPRRARGAQHGPAARAARHRQGTEVRGGLLRRGAPALPGGAVDPLGDQRLARRGHEPPDGAALGGGRDRGGDPRTALPRASERLPADEHRDGRDALLDRARLRGAHGQRDGVRPLLRHRHDRARPCRPGAHRVGRRDLRGVGRLRDRERRAERDHERGLLRRQRLARAGGAARAGRDAGRRRGRPAARGPRRQGAAPDGAARRAADRLRVLQPHHARLRPQGAPRRPRATSCAAACPSTCSRTRRTSRRSTCSSSSSGPRPPQRPTCRLPPEPQSLRISSPRSRQARQIRSTFGSRKPIAIAGRAGRPATSHSVVRISVSASSADHGDPRPARP